MKTVGIIAEYNPFHNGHLYHIKKARELTGADFVIVVMSGDYTQRGVPAVYSKYLRTKTALLCGADLVFEMPVYGSVSSASDFADCGVSLLSSAGITDFLCFGSETGNLWELQNIQKLYENETPEISSFIKSGLKAGLSWPKAHAKAYADMGSIPQTPNDILGVEYLRALKKYRSSMTPAAVVRTDPGYHSKERCGAFASATAIRSAISEHNEDFVKNVVPSALLACLSEEDCPEISLDDFTLILNEKLLTKKLCEIEAVSDMPKDLAAKLWKNRLYFHNAADLTAFSKDRQYTYARINRCLLSLTLGITKEDAGNFKEFHSAPWLRILGFGRQAAPLLSQLKKSAAVPVITKTANARRLLSPKAYALFEKHLVTAELYRMVCERKTGKPMKNEFTRSLILL